MASSASAGVRERSFSSCSIHPGDARVGRFVKALFGQQLIEPIVNLRLQLRADAMFQLLLYKQAEALQRAGDTNDRLRQVDQVVG